MTISAAVRRQVRERANFLCEYCHSSEETSAAQFEIDHILPRSLGGSDQVENLALACQRCNGYRYNFTTGMDAETQTMQSLFNPRQQAWAAHFVWTADGLRIMGITASTSLGSTFCLDSRWVANYGNNVCGSSNVRSLRSK
jgi:hypothetical protein